MKSHLSTKELSELRKKLPHGSLRKISNETGFDISTVSKVFKGDFFNKSIIDQAIFLVEERNEEILKLKESIKKL